MSGRTARSSKSRKRDAWDRHWTALMLDWNTAWEEVKERPSILWPMQPVTMTVTAIDRVERTITVSTI